MSSLGHISAHRRTFGNESADALAKNVTKFPMFDYFAPASHSYVKRILRSKLFKEWQDH